MWSIICITINAYIIHDLFALPLAQTPISMRTPPFFNVFQPSSSSNLVVASSLRYRNTLLDKVLRYFYIKMYVVVRKEGGGKYGIIRRRNDSFLRRRR